MKNVVIFGAIAALFVFTGCPKEKVNVVGGGDETIQTQAPESSDPISTPLPAESAADLLGSVYFDFDKFVIRPDMQGAVDEIAEKVKEQSAQIVIEGNTDEFGTDEYNYALGTKRAIAVRDVLVVKGANKDNIRVISFGESKPVCMDKTKECYQENRRSDVKASK